MRKTVMWLFIFIGGTVGGLIPVWLAHVGYFSPISIIASTLGGVAGWYASHYLDNWVS